MIENDSERQLVLSASEVKRWRIECAEIDREVEALHRKKDNLLKRIAAAELLGQSLFSEDEPQQVGDGRQLVRKRKGRATWTSVIEEHVRMSGTGMIQKNVLQDLRKGPYGERLKESESGYYNAIQKLLKRGLLVKRGEYLFTPAQYHEYMKKLENGEVKDVAENAAFGSPAAAEIVKFVAANPGRKSIDLIRAVWDAYVGDHPPSKTSLYNTIARLVEQKHIRKRKGQFYPCETNEAPDGATGGASQASEGGASLETSISDEKVTPLFTRALGATQARPEDGGPQGERSNQ